MPQLPQVCDAVSTSPGEHTPWPEQVLHVDHVAQPQLALHVRVRVRVPQSPQPCFSVCFCPGAQVVCPEPTQAPPWQKSLAVHAFPSLHQAPLGV